MTDKLRMPCTSCTYCRVVGYDISRSNTACRRVLDRKGKKCKGSISSAINIGDWEECPSCDATGTSGGETCTQCSGAGWIFVRGMP